MKEKRFISIALAFMSTVLIFLSILLLIPRADSTEVPIFDNLYPGTIADSLYPAIVERVIDGDTIVVDLYLGLGIVLDDQYLRFYGIDAWETRGEERPKGLLAKEFLIELLEHEQVIIEINPEWGSRGKGKYGRWLAVIYVARTGVNVNELLVNQGHAESATY